MERNYSIDFIKYFATLFVVAIHANPTNDEFFQSVKETPLDIVVDTFARFAVPFFFIVSGYLFTQKLKMTPNPFAYFKKYTLNITKLYICWYTFYLCFGVLLRLFQESGTWADRKADALNYATSALALEKIFYYCETTSHGFNGFQLWYLIALIWCIGIVYIFFKMKRISLLLVLSLFLYIVGLFGQSYSVFFNISFETRDALFFGLFYTVLGSFFSYYYESIKARLSARPSIYLLLFLLFSCLEVAERFLLVNILGGHKGDYFISTIFLSISLFLFVLNSPKLGKDINLSKIGKNSVGIYIVHVGVLFETYKILLSLNKPFFTNSVVDYFIITPIVFIISYFVYRLLQVLKKYLYLIPNGFNKKTT
ncbi:MULTISPECIES: acyltransferase [Bacillus]|uniref:Racemase n=2 Tax=Bacillus TaxID=1386 RepID=A0A0M4FPG9_9BACI|nr:MULTISPECIES: acyltransferase [Bacillus]ALC80797.1 racemase [Bacillus gobiensis]MBP1079714.1 surface polysaccharide O-acyltransferase-like enzyme [Bacillus capparidis]MED1095111.1 acyltransferase [Bacillus capparidis]